MSIIYLRPHHLICNICFEGKGYNQIFIDNFTNIHKQLSNNNCYIQLVKNSLLDDICKYCPENNSLHCVSEDKVSQLDSGYLKLFKLNYSDILNVNDVDSIIKRYLTLNDFRKICNKCSWYKYGICEKKIFSLLYNNDKYVNFNI